MFRIRFHGRGGQGMKTASRILGTAFFKAGYQVQDAPRYGAERRGAPIFAYVRADRKTINERGIINHPGLVVVADDTLIGMSAAGVTQGVDKHTLLLLNSHESAETWRQRLNTDARILILEAREDVEDRTTLPYIGSRCAAAAAALTGVISDEFLLSALSEELGHLPYTKPRWIELPFENAAISNFAIHAGATSVKVRTGLWRTMRPVINYENCRGCTWICSTYCPDGAINVRADGYPDIDYDHCKGCLVCVAQCPPHAIESIAEHIARDQESEVTA